MERAPLLNRSQEGYEHYNSNVEEEIVEGIRPARLRTRYYIGAVCGLAVLCLLLVTFTLLPKPQDIKEQMISTTNAELVRFHIDGWSNDDGKGLNTEHGKELQVSTSFKVWFDYDNLGEDGRKLKFINKNIVRTVCFRLNNVTSYNSLDSLGSIRIAEPVCLNVRGSDVNNVNVTIFVKPKMRAIIGVLKKIWKHDYEQLDLWSQVDVKVLKGFIPVLRLRSLKINWDDIINWDKITKELDEFSHVLTNPNIKLENINVKEITSGLYVVIKPGVDKLFRDVGKLLRHRLNFTDEVYIPSLEYQVRVPNCFEEYNIDLSNAELSTVPFNYHPDHDHQPHNLQLQCELGAPLPEELVNRECWSTNNNRITPLTKMLNKLLSFNEKIGFMVKANVASQEIRAQDTTQLNPVIPLDLLDEALDSVGYIPVTGYSGLNSSKDLLDECVIEDMKLKWEDSRLKVVGKLYGQMNFSFYEPLENSGQNDSISVSNLKGKIKLYHGDKHFANVPMKDWVPVDSQIEDHVLHIGFVLDTDQVEVLDRWELTKVLNEIMFQTQTEVQYKNLLDIQVSSILGNFEVLGLEWEGSTIVT
ncbi:uncharacterized protein RNJ44_00006 [Nakaseomyces bracarensis]|uniref:Uncharacterized protein n=1 Tax=Nakaseomyces bracarensis TaxID=273131 RepID=A0ABR4P0V2_9SACH